MVQDLTDEIWKPILGYENLYSVSNKGRVKTPRKQWITKHNRQKEKGHIKYEQVLIPRQ